jgi:hypothetical protein
MKADLQDLLPPLHILVEGRAGERRFPGVRFRAS